MSVQEGDLQLFGVPEAGVLDNLPAAEDDTISAVASIRDEPYLLLGCDRWLDHCRLLLTHHQTMSLTVTSFVSAPSGESQSVPGLTSQTLEQPAAAQTPALALSADISTFADTRTSLPQRGPEAGGIAGRGRPAGFPAGPHQTIGEPHISG